MTPLSALVSLGMKKENIIVIDRSGVIYHGRSGGLAPHKKLFASNTTARTREAGEDAQATNILGVESRFGEIFPEAIDPTSLVDLSSDSNHTGKGSVDRNESIKVKLPATVTQVLPNGNLVISGRQEVRVNFEVRELTVSGIVRPEDISATNTVSHEQIAEARVSYGGRGQLSDVQQPRYGQQIFDILFPF